MAKVWEYPRWRHAAMQGIMWIILLASIGLAALTDYHLRDAMRINLGSEVSDGPMRFSLPRGWTVQSLARPGAWSHQAVEPAEDGEARTLIVSRQRVDGTLQPIEFMLWVDPALRAAAADTAELRIRTESVVIAGWPGVKVTEQGYRLDGEGNRIPYKALIACVVLSSGEAIEIEVRGFGTVDGRDEELLRQEIESIKLSAPPPTPGGEVVVYGSASLTAPRSLLVIPTLDPNRTDRLLIDPFTAGKWMSVDLIPWIRLPDQPPQAVEQMLRARDVQRGLANPGSMDWLASNLQQEKPAGEKPSEENVAQWRLDPPAGSSMVRRAYALADPTGQGLLVVFRADGSDGSGRIDQAWAQLAGTIHFDSTLDLPSLLKEGADQAGQIRSEGLGRFIGTQPRRAYWLASDPSPEGTTAIYEYGLTSGGKRTVKLLRADRSVVNSFQTWHASNDLKESHSEVVRKDWPDGADEPAATSNQSFDADGSNIQASFNCSHRTVSSESAQLPQFLPSGILPAALARVAQRPMILQTDQFPGLEAEPALLPITLLVRPIPPPADRAADSQAALGVEVEVSGYGTKSRWFFQADGQLDHAELPASLRLSPATVAEIQARFPDDSRLTNPLR